MHNQSTNVKQLFQKDGKIAVTSKNAKDGSVYLALFNISDKDSQKVSVNLSDLGISGSAEVLNMWTGEKSKTASKSETSGIRQLWANAIISSSQLMN